MELKLKVRSIKVMLVLNQASHVLCEHTPIYLFIFLLTKIIQFIFPLFLNKFSISVNKYQ